MKRFLLAARMLRRNWSAGELRVLLVALFIAVASVTTVGFFADRVEALAVPGTTAIDAASVARTPARSAIRPAERARTGDDFIGIPPGVIRAGPGSTGANGDITLHLTNRLSRE